MIINDLLLRKFYNIYEFTIKLSPWSFLMNIQNILEKKMKILGIDDNKDLLNFNFGKLCSKH